MNYSFIETLQRFAVAKDITVSIKEKTTISFRYYELNFKGVVTTDEDLDGLISNSFLSDNEAQAVRNYFKI